MTTPTTLTTLDELYNVLTMLPNTRETAEAYGLPYSLNDDTIDWTSLPVFGGSVPTQASVEAAVGHSRSSLWSWDATRLLVGTCADDLSLLDRE